MTRQHFQVRAHYLMLALVWYGLTVCFGLQNLNKLVLGDMTRQNFQVKAHYFRFSLVLVWFGGFVWSAKLEQFGAWR
jgi:ABC-type cobalamin transport system permease subunit